MIDAIRLLRERYAQLHPMTEPDWRKLAPHVRVVELPKGGVFLRAGEVSQDCAFLASGMMRAFYQAQDGRECVSAFRPAGSFVCVYESFLTQRPSRLTIEALEPCVLARFSLAPYRQLVTTDPFWCHIGRILIERRYIEQEERIYEALACRVEERWQLLKAKEAVADKRLSQRQLAAYLGVARETVNRLIRGSTTH
jgi:CRP-like cAMP-binding protein